MDKATFLSIMAGLTSGSFLIGQQLGGQTVATIEASYNETIAGLTTETGKTPAVVGLSITGNKGTGTLAELTTLAEFLAANGVTIVQGYYEPVNYSQGLCYSSMATITTNQDFLDDLDKLITIIDAFNDNGILVLLNPFCEMTFAYVADPLPADGSRWWYIGLTSGSSYISMWRFVHDYVEDGIAGDNVVWVFEPKDNNREYSALLGGWPGSAYVDLVGFSIYESNPLVFRDEVYESERGIYTWNQLVGLGKPTGISQYGPGYDQHDGSYDTTDLLDDVLYFDGMSYVFEWSSWGSGLHKVALIDCTNADLLMNSSQVITRESLTSGSTSGSFYYTDPHIIALWSLDETSGSRFDYKNINNLADNNTVGSDTVDKKEGLGCATFTRASSQKLSITDALQSGLDIQPPFTIAGWIYPDSNGNTDGILGKWGTSQYAYQIYRLSGSPYGLRVRLSANGTTYTSFSSDSGVSAAWHYYTVVVNGVDVRIYVDGVLDTASPGAWTSAIHNSTAPFVIGDRGDGNYFGGKQDQTVIFDRALSADEVAVLAEYGVLPPVPVAYTDSISLEMGGAVSDAGLSSGSAASSIGRVEAVSNAGFSGGLAESSAGRANGVSEAGLAVTLASVTLDRDMETSGSSIATILADALLASKLGVVDAGMAQAAGAITASLIIILESFTAGYVVEYVSIERISGISDSARSDTASDAPVSLVLGLSPSSKAGASGLSTLTYNDLISAVQGRSLFADMTLGRIESLTLLTNEAVITPIRRTIVVNAAGNTLTVTASSRRLTITANPHRFTKTQ